MNIYHNNPQWHDPNPFAHIKGVYAVVDPSLAAHQWRPDGGKVRDITDATAAQVRKLAQVVPKLVEVAAVTNARGLSVVMTQTMLF